MIPFNYNLERGLYYYWQPNTSLNDSITQATWASPDSTTTYYADISTFCETVTDTFIVKVNPKYLTSLPEQMICSGDSTFLFGEYQNIAGTYYDSLQTIYGCDSIISQELKIISIPITQLPSTAVCAGG